MERRALGLFVRLVAVPACLLLFAVLATGCGGGGRVAKKEIEKVDASSAAGPLQGFPPGSDPKKIMQEGKGPGFGDAKKTQKKL